MARLGYSPITHFDANELGVTGRAIVRHAGVLKYLKPNGTYRSELVHPDFLRRKDSAGLPIARVIAGIPSTHEHPTHLFRGDRTRIDAKKVGGVGKKMEFYRDGDIEINWHVDSAHKDTIDGIRGGDLPGVSLGYDCETIVRPGWWGNEYFDALQAEPFTADHMAHTARPRAGRAMITRMDSSSDIYLIEHVDAEDAPYQPWSTLRRTQLRYGEFDGAFAGPGMSYPIASRADCAKFWVVAGSDGRCDSVRTNIVAIANRFGWTDGLPESAHEWADSTQTPLTTRRSFGVADSQTYQIEIQGQPFRVDSDLYEAITTERADMAKKYDMKGEGEDEETMDALTSELEFERARADTLDAELEAHKSGGNLDSSSEAFTTAVATEAAHRLDAWNAARPYLPADVKFDSALDRIGIYKMAIAAQRPGEKFDSASNDFVVGMFQGLPKADSVEQPKSQHHDSTQKLRTDLSGALGNSDGMAYEGRRDPNGTDGSGGKAKDSAPPALTYTSRK